jgi:hypothetical protein
MVLRAPDLEVLGNSGWDQCGYSSCSKGGYRDRCVKYYVTLKIDNFKWFLVSLYGATQHEQKSYFLSELVRRCEDEPVSMLVGGISMLSYVKKKKNDNFDA